jgi:hypothetical protein
MFINLIPMKGMKDYICGFRLKSHSHMRNHDCHLQHMKKKKALEFWGWDKAELHSV